jgi:hypothetical protein
MTKRKEAFKDYVAKMSLKYITQTKDEMLREVEEDVEQMKIHAIKKVIATSIKNSLIIPSPNTDEDVTYMEKLGFILNKDKNGKYEVNLENAEKDSEAQLYISRTKTLRKSAASVVMKKIKEAMINDKNKVTITPEMISKECTNRLKYFPEWLSPELERAGFKPVLTDDEQYVITW